MPALNCCCCFSDQTGSWGADRASCHGWTGERLPGPQHSRLQRWRLLLHQPVRWTPHSATTTNLVTRPLLIDEIPFFSRPNLTIIPSSLLPQERRRTLWWLCATARDTELWRWESPTRWAAPFAERQTAESTSTQGPRSESQAPRCVFRWALQFQAQTQLSVLDLMPNVTYLE